MQPLRVAHFTLGRCNPDSANGVDKTVYHLARAQAALGHAVTVFSLTSKPPLPIPGVDVRVFAPLRPRLPLLTERQYDLLVTRAPWNVPERLVAQIAEWRPDILHLHYVHLPPNVFLVRRLPLPIPYCVTINGGLSPLAQQRSQWIKKAFGLLFEREYLRRAAFLHAISGLDCEGLQHYGVSNVTVLAPNGIEVPLVPPSSESAHPFDERLRGRQAFVFLGRLDPQQKGLDLLLEAFARCRIRDSALVLAGPDWRGARDRLERMARTLGIGDDVWFAGPVFGDRKRDLLQSAYAFVHPSRWEAGVPFSVLEAAALGRPCLVTPASDPNGLLERAGGAVSTEPTVESIAAGLHRISGASDRDLGNMGARARDLVSRQFSWPRTAEVLVDAYRRYAVSRG